MSVVHLDEWLTVHGGDNRDVMRTLPAESVQCVVTSPPYWGLRDYGTASWDGGDPECDHKQTVARHDGGRVNVAGFHSSARTDSDKGAMNYRDICGKCGATRQDRQLGLESTPEAYVAAMVDVFREVRRVLRPDGTLWLNLGDSYAAARSYQVTDSKHIDVGNTMAAKVPDGLKAKDLVGIPWRVAFALQADGWYLRSDIIWSKPNPMPESVTDRPTKAHEYLFLLSKSERYHYYADAIREDAAAWNSARGFSPGGARAALGVGYQTGRNRRSVWTIATKPYPGAHFATFPEALVEPCILAGCPEGGTVMDPFGGTGTVGVVAQRLSRRAVLIDLNADYLAQCLERNRQAPLGLTA